MKKKTLYISSGIVVIAIALVVAVSSGVFSGPGEYDDLAKCMTEKGVTFYGAYWCPHCADQKKEFGNSFKHVNYVECSLPNRAGQTQICIENGIESYPTWEFEDGSRQTGLLTPLELSTRTKCLINPE